jgi:RHO1 GDP-GTP exchange protein 1/2
LLLEAVLKQTPQDHPDHINLPKVIKIIKEFLTNVNVESGKSENRFNLQQLNDQLIPKGEHMVNIILFKIISKYIFIVALYNYFLMYVK